MTTKFMSKKYWSHIYYLFIFINCILFEFVYGVKIQKFCTGNLHHKFIFLVRGVIEAKSEGRKILLTDFDYANGAHNAMTKINNFLNFITIFLYKNLLNFTLIILRMQSKQLSKYLLWSIAAVFQCIEWQLID